MIDSHTKIVLFDGECLYCNRFIVFLISNSLSQHVKFLPLKSERSLELLSEMNIRNDYKSIILISDDNVLKKSSAILDLFGSLESSWKYVTYLKYIPRMVRDSIYDIVSRLRYSFGRLNSRSQCQLPNHEARSYFL